MRTLSIAEARNKLTQLPDEFAQDAQDGAITVTRHGKPVLAIMPYDLYDSIVETLEIMSDPELMTELRKSIHEASQGDTIPWATARKKLQS